MTSHPVSVPVETIAAAKSGDRRAFEAMFRAYHPALIRYLRSVARDLADDVASQTWVSVTRSIADFEGDGDAFRGWLLTIGRRRLVDEFRRQGRRIDDVVEVPEMADTDTPADLIAERIGWAQRLLSQLPPQQAEVVMLRVIGGLSVAEVASTTGLAAGNVRVLSHRGLVRLLELLADDDEVAEGIPALRVTESCL